MPDIKGYEGLYFVTSCGKVWSYKKKSFLKPYVSNWGYLRVNLYGGSVKMKHESVHRLVAIAYIPNPNNYPQVNHKDENKRNNSANNLEWMTAKQNSNYGTRIKKISDFHKKKIRCITTGEVFDSQTEAAIKYGVQQWHISNCCTGIKEHVKGLQFEFYGGV